MSPTDRAPGGAAAGWVLVLPALALAALALAGPIASADLWWHLSMGHWMIDHRALPQVDPFSHTLPDSPCELQEYAAQVLFALVERAGGIPALRAFGALLAAALVACVFLVARRRLPPAWAAASASVFAALYGLKWELRPHVLSSFLLLAVARALFPAGDASAPGPRRWLAVLGLAALWTQLHAESVFAPILAGAGSIGALLAALQGRAGGWRDLARWLAALLAAWVGTLLSPGGLAQVRYALQDSSVPRDYIDEWFPLWELRLLPAPLLALVLACLAGGAALVGVGALARLRAPRGPRAPSASGLPWERIGFLAVCLVMAVLARRFLFLLWFPAHELLVLAAARVRRPAARLLSPALLAVAACLVLARTHFVADALASARGGLFARSADASLLPLHAVDFAAEAGIEGRLYHPYEWGGYLGRRLWPGCRVYLDGRTVMFAAIIPERWRLERWDALGERAQAAELLARRGVDVIVMPSLVDHGRGPLRWRPPAAEGDGGPWVRAWVDATATVWLRGPESANAQRAAAWYARRGVPFDPREGAVEAALLAVHPEWLRGKDLLAAPVRARLEPLYGPGRDAPADAFERARAYLAVGMRRSAAWELDRALAARFAGDPTELARWRERVAAEGAEGVIAFLAGGGG